MLTIGIRRAIICTVAWLRTGKHNIPNTPHTFELTYPIDGMTSLKYSLVLHLKFSFCSTHNWWLSYGSCFVFAASFVTIFNSSPHSAAYMRLWFGSTFVQIMANYLLEPLGNKCQCYLNRNSNIFINKCIWKCRQRNGDHFVSASRC